MKAMLTLSLGGTYPAPPSTRRGTMERPTAAAAVCARNLRRESGRSEKVRDRIRFFTVPPRLQLADAASIWLLFTFCEDLPQCERPDYCKEPEDAVAKITSPRVRKSCALRRDELRLAGDGFGDALILRGSAAIEEAACG